jgi:uncharacterized protein (TIGR04255 family)
VAESPLPDFERPPVVEVALAVQFRAPRLDPLQVALFAASVADEFPRREQHPSRPPISEDFAVPSTGVPFQIEIFDRPPMPRFWLMSEAGDRLLQVQQDLVALNWRKIRSEDEYPRYPALRQAFAERLSELTELLKSSGASAANEEELALQPNWCEVTYVNHVGPVSSAEARPHLHELLTFVDAPDVPVGPPEDAQLFERFLIDRGESPVGRLHLSAVPAFSAEDQRPMYSLTLVARIQPFEPTVDAALSALDVGREAIVRTFRDTTTKEMHMLWGLKESA